MDQELLTKTPEPGTTYRLTITDEKTGLPVMDFPGTRGGFFVMNDEPDRMIGTKQGIFGALDAIIVSVAKSEAVIAQAIKQSPPEVSEAITKGLELYKKAVEGAR